MESEIKQELVWQMLHLKIVSSPLLWVQKGHNCTSVIDSDNGHSGSTHNFWRKQHKLYKSTLL